MLKKIDIVKDDPPKKLQRLASGDNINQSQGADFHCSATMSYEREAGVIEEVVLQNFMSHNKLHFKFGSHVNFIVGLNGSGKSSILTAIIVGLGGRAAVTNRGKTLKSLIKTGCQKASVSVRLRNQGTDAYKWDVYGDSITIQRTITEKVSSTFKIYDANGNLKAKDSQARHELDAILDSFNILIDNPMVVLNQDTSKEFMLSKSPSDYYKFFLRATQLEQIENDHSDAKICKEVASEEIKQKHALLPMMKREVQIWEQKYNACSSLDKLNSRINQLKQEMAWAFVWEKERDLKKIKLELSGKEESRPGYANAVGKCERKIAEKEEHHKKITEELKAAGSDASDLEHTLSEKKDFVNQKRRAAKTDADCLRQCNRELHGIVSDRNEIGKRIQELKNSAPVDYAAQREAREQSISDIQRQLSDETATLKTMELDAEQFRNTVLDSEQKVRAFRGKEQDLKIKLQVVKKRLVEYESSGGSDLGKFNSFMPELVRQIDEAHRRGKFSEKPRGPLGAYIKLQDKRWALPIEKCLGVPLMSAFAINNYRDEKEFEQIASRVCRRQSTPTTIVSRFQRKRHDVPKNPYRERFPTVLEMLDIDDPVVANCLIDQRGVEHVLLAENVDAGTDLMLHGRPGPFNELYTINADQLFAKPCFKNYASNGGSARLLTTNLGQLISGCKVEKRQLEDLLEGNKEQIAEAELEMKLNIQEQKTAAEQQQKVRERITNIKLEVVCLNNTEISAPVDVQALEEEEQILSMKISALQNSQQVLVHAVDESARQLKDAEAELKGIDNRIRSAAQKLEPFRSELANFDNEIDRFKQELKHYRQKQKEFEKEVSEIKKRCDAVKREVEETMENAKQVRDEPVRTCRTSQNLESEIVQIQKQITIEQKNHGDPDEIKKLYLEKKQQYDTIFKELDSLSMFISVLAVVISKREHWLRCVRESLSLELQFRFWRYLYMRSEFSGRLDVNHKDKSIEMIVFPRSGIKDTELISNRSLSGGERSFATTCFILALWDNMHSPFHCLDEFDVFMDLINRRHSMDMMIKEAAMKPGSQFVFLSPLNMSQLNLDIGSVDVKIMEMAAPRSSYES